MINDEKWYKTVMIWC